MGAMRTMDKRGLKGENEQNNLNREGDLIVFN